MNIIQSSDFLSVTKDHHILLDTSIFFDAIDAPGKFATLFNELKENGCTLVTLKVVLTEFMKGGADKTKLEGKRLYVEEIIDVFFPLTNDIIENTSKLVEIYKEDGKTVSITDFLLGATIMKYSKMHLMTCDTGDFPNNIFKLETYATFIYRKGIKTCGMYSFLPR